MCVINIRHISELHCTRTGELLILHHSVVRADLYVVEHGGRQGGGVLGQESARGGREAGPEELQIQNPCGAGMEHQKQKCRNK